MNPVKKAEALLELLGGSGAVVRVRDEARTNLSKQRLMVDAGWVLGGKVAVLIEFDFRERGAEQPPNDGSYIDLRGKSLEDLTGIKRKL